jgi:dTDP-4-dehydrorhamnose 3,5-epimerase
MTTIQVRQIHEGGVLVFTPIVHRDKRGAFIELFRDNEIRPYVKHPFVQANASLSGSFVIRGLHYQLRKSKSDIGQGKLIRCLYGKIMQVSVDVRKDSATFGKWVHQHLDDVAQEAVYVPPGFANGFFSFERGAVVQYEMTAYHDEERARTLAWNDGGIGIKWPMGPGAGAVMSSKDRQAPWLGQIEQWT